MNLETDPIADLVAHSLTLSLADQQDMLLDMVDSNADTARIKAYAAAIPPAVVQAVVVTMQTATAQASKKEKEDLEHKWAEPVKDDFQQIANLFHLDEMGIRYYVDGSVSRSRLVLAGGYEKECGYGRIDKRVDNVWTISFNINEQHYEKHVNLCAFAQSVPETEKRLQRWVREFVYFCGTHKVAHASAVARKFKAASLLD